MGALAAALLAILLGAGFAAAAAAAALGGLFGLVLGLMLWLEDAELPEAPIPEAGHAALHAQALAQRCDPPRRP